MDVIYAALHRRQSAGPVPAGEAAEAAEATEVDKAGEAAEVRAVLWAHARPDDGLQHITVRSEADRVDLLVYLASRDPAVAEDTLSRAHVLIARGHQASPLMRRRYQPPAPPSR
ncbi:hypothetical protein ACFVX9_38235 [Kitasatospora sp. NPDC058243]|uniref:hypothetical protein n=1 Tax=Kitasatospora sp. NPDC058243 TaxID=3346397 RepID=UPI0036DC7E3B